MEHDWTPDDIRALLDSNSQKLAAEACSNIEKRIVILSENVERTLGMAHLSDNDRRALLFAKQEIGPRWADLLHIISDLGKISPDLCSSLARTLDLFTAGLVQGADKGGVTKSAWDFVEKRVKARGTRAGRDGSQKKRVDRDNILDREFGKLVDRGLTGGRLRDATLKILSQTRLPDGLSEPSQRTVTVWAKNHRDTGCWRPRSDPQV